MESNKTQKGPPFRVLVVEDNRDLVSNLFSYLEARHFSLDAAQDGVSGLHRALEGVYDAIILDWMLPRMDGPELVRQLRDKGLGTPVLMLTARDELPSKIIGFKSGADDYLTKPFELAELEVRLEALIARGRGRHRVLRVGDLTFDLSTHEIARAGTPLRMHAACRKLLEVLMRESPAMVRRERLERVLWGDDPPDHDMLRSHIYELRKSVDAPFETKLIQTLPKVGYCIVAEAQNQ